MTFKYYLKKWIVNIIHYPHEYYYEMNPVLSVSREHSGTQDPYL